MSNILAKWLHHLWFFPNIRDILIKLLHLLGDFPKIRETLIVIYTFTNVNLKIIGISHNQCIQCVQCVQCVQKYYNFFFPNQNYISCNYNTMSFLGHPVCHLGLNWCILLGLFIVFPALAKCLCCLLFPLGNQNMGKAHSNANIPLRTK